MTIIRKGFHLELHNRATNRVLFSAATDQLDKATFDALWKAIGDQIYTGGDRSHMDSIGYYELRVSPIL